MRAQDRIQPALGGTDPADTDGLAELFDVDNPIARKGIHDQTAVIQRRDLQRVDVAAEDPVVIANDLLDQRQFEG